MKDVFQRATEIAEALEVAHKQGIVHRDLKPSNIMLTPQGHAKVLDFGLAKQLRPPEGGESQEDTITGSLTKAGATVGTVAYMSPEQLRGEEVDARSDIFSFGIVLYEMLTGADPFKKPQPLDTASSILKEEPPPLSQHRDDVSPVLQHTVRKMLTKERKRRYQHIDDLLIDLGGLISEIAESSTTQAGIDPFAGTAQGMGAPVTERSWRQMVPWLFVSLVVGVIITLIVVWVLSPPPETRPLVRSAIVLPSTERLSGASRHVVALSPDGTRLVYTANDQLYLRAMDQLEAVPIRGTEGNARSPFFSPDGQWVGFWAEGQLKKVPTGGGAPVVLCGARNLWGASWGPDDRIVFGQGPEGIWQVSAAGGAKEVLIGVDSTKSELSEAPLELLSKLLIVHELYHGPQILPGGKAVLFTVGFGGTWDDAQIVVQSLETGERQVLINGGTDARYVPTGHLVYVRAGTLLGVPFDLERLDVTGPPVPIGEGIRQGDANVTGAAQFSCSHVGSHVYVPGIRGKIERTLVWVDREGQVERLAVEPRSYSRPRISPDGQRLAITVSDSANSDVWIYDLAGQRATRLTFDPADDHNPLWTPDSQGVVFSSNRDGGLLNLFWKAADGTSQVERLTTSPNYQIPYSWSSDGKRLVFVELVPETFWDIGLLSMEGEPTSQPLLQTQFAESLPAISPDGRWMAYQSDESGRHEVYVTPFPGPGPKQQLSTEGATEPVWAPDGRELFYREGDKVMAVPVKTHPEFTAGKSKLLFAGPYISNEIMANYDITPDGRRFLMIKASEQESGPAQIFVVLNWFEELTRRAPTDK